jgi:hypothetical protein
MNRLREIDFIEIPFYGSNTALNLLSGAVRFDWSVAW